MIQCIHQQGDVLHKPQDISQVHSGAVVKRISIVIQADVNCEDFGNS